MIKSKTSKKTPKVEKKVDQDDKNKQTTELDIKWWGDDSAKYPSWYIELFNHVEYIENNNISVYNTEPVNKRQKATYELERKLFLVFMASPKKIFTPNENWVWWDRKILTQQDFAKVSWVEQNTLWTWKWKKWFHENRIHLMKYMFSKRTPDVIENLYEWATQKDDKWKTQTPAVKLFLEYIEGFKQSIEHSWAVVFKDTKELDKADLDELKDTITQHLREK